MCEAAVGCQGTGGYSDGGNGGWSVECDSVDMCIALYDRIAVGEWFVEAALPYTQCMVECRGLACASVQRGNSDKGTSIVWV